MTRLDKRDAPAAFNPYDAMCGVAQEGKKSYICATFNLDGLGKSGNFQNVRGLYVIERRKHAHAPFYSIGNIASNVK